MEQRQDTSVTDRHHELPSLMASKSEVLRPHQQDVFNTSLEFLDNGGQSGLIIMPTGTGKTVLFIELAKAIYERQRQMEQRGDEVTRKKILVVVPRINLLRQTSGESLEGRGFAHFAPELPVGTIYGATDYKQVEALADTDIIITTYQSLKHFFRRADELTDEQNPVEVMNRINSMRDDKKKITLQGAIEYIENRRKNSIRNVSTVIFDEGHHLLGHARRQLFEALPPEVQSIVLTATPESGGKTLEDMIEVIYRMELQEAIESELLSPLQLITVASGQKLDGVRLKGNGTYDDDSLERLIEATGRDAVGLEFAERFINQGMQGIISCVSGDNIRHARVMADKLNELSVFDTKTGDLRPVRAQWVGHLRTPKENEKILQAYERGEYDVLTYTEMLGEGWDSLVAKFLINLRPSRSMRKVMQRIGRVSRRQDELSLSYVVDVVDELRMGDRVVPPITARDALGLTRQPNGMILRSIETPNELVQPIFSTDEIFSLAMPTTTYEGDNERMLEISRMTEIVGGGDVIFDGQGGFCTSIKLSRTFDITDRILERLIPHLREGEDYVTIIRSGKYDYAYKENPIAKLLYGDSLPVLINGRYNDGEVLWVEHGYVDRILLKAGFGDYIDDVEELFDEYPELIDVGCAIPEHKGNHREFREIIALQPLLELLKMIREERGVKWER